MNLTETLNRTETGNVTIISVQVKTMVPDLEVDSTITVWHVVDLPDGASYALSPDGEHYDFDLYLIDHVGDRTVEQERMAELLDQLETHGRAS